MKKINLPPKQINTDYVKLAGGLDLATPVLSLKPGSALDAVNYEPGVKGGYQRIDGFERIDGRPAPASASYTYIECSITGMILPGYVLTGATSGATGTVLVVGQGELSVSKVTGTFVNGEALNYSGGAVATVTAIPLARGYRTAKDDAIALAAAADLYRADIQAVPGSGPVRGAWMYKGILYAFRDNAGGTACVMHKATAAGWAAVTMYHEVAITTSGAMTTEIIDGNTVIGASSSATAVVKRVMRQSGSWAGSNVKARLVLSNIVGAFSPGEIIKVGATNVATLVGEPLQITLKPGGRYEFANYNFAGSTATNRMYGCDGKNRAFEFDGEVYAPIATGMTQDTPKFLAVHKKKLFLAFLGSLQNSGDGLPFEWTVVSGANEFGMGDDIVGMAVQPGDTLAVFTRNTSWQLNGTTTSSFQLLPISGSVGAIPYTVQSLGRTYALDDRGVIETSRVQSYGNFDQATVSEPVQQIIDAIRGKVVASTTYNSRNQYRLYCSDGEGLIMAMSGDRVAGFTQLRYPVAMNCAYSCEDATGKSVVFLGGANGYVYQADRGSSFDGADIEAYLRVPFPNQRGPRYRKRYHKAVLEMTGTAYASIRFQPEFSYGDPDVATHRLQTGEVTGAGGYWDVSAWESFYYDARLVSNPQFSIEGTGLNLLLLFYSKSAIDLGHQLQGVIVHNSIRRLER